MSTPAAQVLSSAASAASSPVAGGGGSPPTAPLPAAAPATPAAGAGAAANEPFWKSWAAPEQKDVREWAQNKAYADPFTLAKSARELEQQSASLRAQASLKGYPADKVNADGTVTKADENAVKAWRELHGVPETPDKYDLPTPENNPYPQFTSAMAAEFHRLGVPPALATEIARANNQVYAKLEAQIREQENQRSEAALLELKQAWGPHYNERVNLAQRGRDWLAKEVGGLSDTQLRQMESLLGTDKFLTAFYKFGEGNRESVFAGDSGNPKGFVGGAAKAQADLDQLIADRGAGKISTEEFRTKSSQYMDIIANGRAPQ